MKIITWNINSIRLRIDHLKKILDEEGPAIICLQETKVADNFFPIEQLKSIGFSNIFFHGEKSYNGVAIISNIPLKYSENLKFCNDDARHISVIIPGDIELHNFYIPSGGDIPDTNLNAKFAHKLDYCDQMADWFKKNRTRNDKAIIVGDLNIAPLPNDVWSHKQLLNEVSHTQVEIEKLDEIYKSIDFEDVIRKFFPENEKIYSWWSYRNRDWKKSNRGRRLDHIWTTPILSDKIKKAYIMSEARDWLLPSDHVPVILELG